MDYLLERSGESGSLFDSVAGVGRARVAEDSGDVTGYRTRGSDRRLAARRAPGAIYLANLCHVIGNFIIFLEASQSRPSGSRARGGSEERGRKRQERKVEKDGCAEVGYTRRLGYRGGPAASREDGYPLFESRNAPDEKCTRLKFTAAKRVRAIWKHTKL